MGNIFNFFAENQNYLYILLFATLLGFELINKVPTVLHTPLMSGSNAISGIVLIGAIILMRKAPAEDTFTIIIGVIAIVFAMINVVGGFVVTDRMLSMFKKK
jgi:H+-translocating NAD(P) transhydrogenase subunit alpha